MKTRNKTKYVVIVPNRKNVARPIVAMFGTIKEARNLCHTTQGKRVLLTSK